MTDTFVHRRRILFGDCDPGDVLYTPRVANFVVEAGLAYLRDRLGAAPERTLFEMGYRPACPGTHHRVPRTDVLG